MIFQEIKGGGFRRRDKRKGVLAAHQPVHCFILHNFIPSLAILNTLYLGYLLESQLDGLSGLKLIGHVSRKGSIAL